MYVYRMPGNNSLYPLSTLSKLSVTSAASDSVAISGGVTIAGALAVTGAITGGSISYASTTTGTLDVSDTTGTTVTVASTRQSTSVGTGAVILQGGLSVDRNLYVGGTLVAGVVTYASTSTGTMTVTTGTGATLTVSSTTDSTVTTDGSATFVGGVGIAKRLNAGSVKCFDSTQSTTTSTGCLQLVGGLGAAGNIYAGGIIVSTNATSSTTTGTGCGIFIGGVGIGENLNVGAVTKSASIEATASTAATNTTTGAIKSVGGISTQGAFYAGGNVSGANISTTSATASTTTSTGALVSLGGLGVVGAGNFDTIKTWNTTDATSTTTGSITTIGGISTTKAIFAGTIVTGNTMVANGNVASTSKTTGTVKVTGGIGITGQVTCGSLYIENTGLRTNGTDLYIFAPNGVYLRPDPSENDNGEMSNTIDIFNVNTKLSNTSIFSIDKTTNTTTLVKLAVTSTTAATSTTTGSATFGGGIGVVGKVYSDTIRTVGNAEIGGFDLVLGTTDQSSRGYTSGSRAMVKIAGGKLYINYLSEFFGGTVVDSSLTISGATILPNTTESTSTTTGAVQIAGGLGIVGNLSGSTAKFYSATDSSSTSTGSVILVGGLGIGATLSGTNARFYASTASTSTTTGAVIIDGGMGVSGTFSFGYAKGYNTTDSTSTSTGGFVVLGGIGVAKNITSDTIKTIGNVEIGGFDLRLGRTDQRTVENGGRGNTGESRALVKDNNGSTTQLKVNYLADFNQVVLGSDTFVLGNLESYNFYSYTVPLDVYNLVGDNFNTLDSCSITISRVGPNNMLNVRYRFSLLPTKQCKFVTLFGSMQTLFNPTTRQIMGTGSVSTFTQGYDVPPYDPEEESFYCYPITPVMEMIQVAAVTVDGQPDASEGFNYVIKAYDNNPIATGLNNNWSSGSTQTTYVANSPLNNTLYRTIYEVNMNFISPVDGYTGTFTSSEYVSGIEVDTEPVDSVPLGYTKY